jgi:hypothetical protein
MSWLYSQALVAEYLADTCSDGAPFAPSNGNHTPRAYLPPDRMTAFSRLSRFGMTFAPLTDDRGAALLTSYLAAFRARTSAQPDAAPESTARAQACGAKWRELSARYDPASSSWRTHRSLWDEALPECSVILPKWGSMRDGVCSELLTSAPRTGASGAGLWATPSATDGQRGGCITENMTGTSLAQMVNTPKRWPTPKANDAEKRGNFDTTNPRNGLPAAVKTWPTPVATMSKGSSPAALTRKDGQDRSNDRLDHAVMAADGGQLNPTWVEWLMGWPLGWTDLRPLETDRFLSAQPQLGDCLEVNEACA